MATIATLAVSITAETTKFAKGVVEASSILNKFDMNVTKLAGKLIDFTAAGLAAAAAGFTYFVAKGFQAIDTLGDVSNKIGINVEALQRLQYAAKLSGVDTETFNGALVKMNSTLGKAQQGNKAAKNAFDQLGLSVSELAGLGTDEQFVTIAAAIGKIKNPAERTAASMQIMGKSAADLLPMFNDGVDGINSAIESSNDLGLVISGIDVAIIQECGDKFDTLTRILMAMGKHIAAELAPYVSAMIDYFIQWTKEAGGTGEIVSSVLSFIGDGLATVIQYGELLYGAFQLIEAAISAVFTAIAGVMFGVAKGISWVIDKINTLVSYFSDYLPDSVVEASKAVNAAFADNATFFGEVMDGFASQTGDLFSSALDHAVNFNNDSTSSGIKKFFNDIKSNADKAGAAIDDANKRKQELAKGGNIGTDIEELQKFADDLFKNTRLPMEKFEEQMRLLTEAFQHGLIDEDLFNRATEKFKKDFEKDTDKKSKGDNTVAKEIDLSRVNIAAFGKDKKEKQEVHDPQLGQVVKAIKEVKEQLKIQPKSVAVVG